MLTAEIKHVAHSDEYMGSAAQEIALEILALTAQRSHEEDEHCVGMFDARIMGLTSHLGALV